VPFTVNFEKSDCTDVRINMPKVPGWKPYVFDELKFEVNHKFH
jgi:hypothetical protein